MSQFGKLLSADLLPSEYPGQDQIEYSYVCVHAAGGNAENGDDKGFKDSRVRGFEGLLFT